MDESILASGIYYWEQENIEESRLEFQGKFDGDEIPMHELSNIADEILFGVTPSPISSNIESLLFFFQTQPNPDIAKFSAFFS